MAQEGAKVVIVARTASTLAEARERDPRGYPAARSSTAAADVSQEVNIERVVAATVERFGRLDVLVNNAGESHAEPLMTVTDQDGRTTST